ncbi:16S rRNA (guanine(527)-N(7))-methyltransferase RsmG [bacterium SCSIO 12741]|nr:16S rRNA (guanine(527)-N(7))-methyltransferase RsmG [bacterium SCSIO 12741]
MDYGIIRKYFPELSDETYSRLELLGPLYREWNEKINVISRKDIDQLYERHVLHSLAIAQYHSFKPGERVLDVGTGGGFPGIPLCILFPETEFTLVDSIGKKIKVVSAVKEALVLDNCVPQHANVKQVKGQFHYVVSRAVTNFGAFYNLVRKNLMEAPSPSEPYGIIYLKGGDLDQELAAFQNRIVQTAIGRYFEEDFFQTKSIIHYY